MALPPPAALILMGDWCGPAEGATPRPAKTRARTGWHDPCEEDCVKTQKKQQKVVNGEVFPLDKSLLMGDPFLFSSCPFNPPIPLAHL
jgi:hypothetical protein